MSAWWQVEDPDLEVSGSFAEEREPGGRTGAFNEDQPRDDHGRWGEGSGGESSGRAPSGEDVKVTTTLPVGTAMFHTTRRPDADPLAYPSGDGESGPGTYTSTDREYAARIETYDPTMRTVEMRTTAPLNVLDRTKPGGEERFRELQQSMGRKELATALREAGFDGVRNLSPGEQYPETTIVSPDKVEYVKGRTAAFSEDQARDDTGKWTSGGGGGDPRAHASELASRARAVEPVATQVMATIAQRSGAELVGLDFRLKTEDSLTRKIGDKVAEGMTPDQAAASIHDSLRYTVAAEPDQYAAAHAVAVDSLRSEGWELAREPRNYWDPGDAYQGLNTWWRTPDGQTVEVQFHTPESARVKEEAHLLYNEARLGSTPPSRRAELEARMAAMWDAVPIPAGARQLAA